MNDLIWAQPTVNSIPYFDWCEWKFFPREDYSQQVRDCVDCRYIMSLLTSPDSSIVIFGCDLILGTLDIFDKRNFYSIDQILYIWQFVFDLSWLINNFMFNVFDWHNGFPIFMDTLVTIIGNDWLTFEVTWAGEISIWLPEAPQQYYVPGWYCPTTPWIAASFSWALSAQPDIITLWAENEDSTWNSITITGDWIHTINEIVFAWNQANPYNRILTIWWDGMLIMVGTATLGWGQDPTPCPENEYMPFNKWLVLTWDDCHQTSFRAVPQCCVQTLTFGEWIINLWSGWHKDNWYVCSCGWCSPAWCTCGNWSSTSVAIPPAQPLESINTDNQSISLNINPGIEELLCLTRWHGWALWVQIPDPDSCVDLININEHTLWIIANHLYLIGSDWLVNSVIDMWRVNEHTIWLTINELAIYGSDLDENNHVDLDEVAPNELEVNGNNLCISKVSTWNIKCWNCEWSCVDIPTGLDCSDVMRCLCEQRIDRVSEWVLVEWWDPCSFDPALTPWISCTDRWKWPAWIAQSYLRWNKVIHLWKRWTSITNCAATDIPWTSANRWITSNSLRPNDAYEMFFSEPRTIGQITSFIQGRFWWVIGNPCFWSWSSGQWGCGCSNGINGTPGVNWSNGWWDVVNIINQIAWYIRRQKYAAKISMSQNQLFFSAHYDYLDQEPPALPGDPFLHRNSPRNWRRFIPNFDKSEWRHSQDSSMISTIDYGVWLPFEHHNEIASDSGSTGTLRIPDETYTRFFWTMYDQSPSTNNVEEPGVPRVQADSRFSRYWSKTITIVKDWYYQISLQWVVQADHNVRAFRLACLRYNINWTALNPWVPTLDLIVDSKFWGSNNVGSWAVTNALVPSSAEYHLWGTKIKMLRAWDILFVWIKIDPRTKRPMLTTGIWVPGTDACGVDIIYDLNALTPDPAFWTIVHVDDERPYSWPYPWTSHTVDGDAYINRNYAADAGWRNITNHQISRWPANLPNIVPHRWGPSGGMYWAQNYWYNLIYPGWYNDTPDWDWYHFINFRYDDWVVTLYWPAWRWNSDWEWLEWESDWASLSVHRVSSLQWDEIDYVITP